jgi:hypothetical protein
MTNRLLKFGAAITAALTVASVGAVAGIASAAGTPAGTVTLTPTTGTASITAGGLAGATNTSVSLGLPGLASYCSGNATSATPYQMSTFIVGQSIDPATIIYGTGTFVATGTGATFAAPLNTLAGAARTQIATGAGPTYAPTVAPEYLWKLANNAGLTNGTYNIGYACYNLNTGAIDTGKFWMSPITITGVTGLSFNWAYGAPATGTTLTASAGDTTASVVSTIPAQTPAVTSAVISVVPAVSGFPLTLSAAQLTTAATGLTIPVTGLTNGTLYTFTSTVTNGVGAADVKTATVTPTFGTLNNVTGLSFTGIGATGATVSWSAPAANAGGQTPAAYIVTVSPTVTGSPFTVTTGTTLSLSGLLVEKTTYSVSVSAFYGTLPSTPLPNPVASAATGSFPTTSNTVIVQDISVNRPNGLLVMTQRCVANPVLTNTGALFTGTVSAPGTTGIVSGSTAGATINGPIAYEPPAIAGKGFPTGLPPSGATSVASITGGPGDNGIAPIASITPFATTPADPTFANIGGVSGYPYPQDALGNLVAPAYPTRCTLNLGNAVLVTTGPNAGQYFAAYGQIDQVTVVNTNDLDAGWNVTGTMSNFQNTFATGANTSFSGDYVGWTPQVPAYVTPAQTDGLGLNYAMSVTAGPNVLQATGALGTGMTAGKLLASSPQFASLGIAQLDARIRVLIPTAVKSGTYHGTLTFQAL